MEEVQLGLGSDMVSRALSGGMGVSRAHCGIGTLLIDLAPALARRFGRPGLSIAAGACGAFVAWAILWGFAQAGFLRRGPTVWVFPVVIGALFGARSGWNAWRCRFGD
ncbi:hypothetical protein [Azospirillum sp. TSO35-2]|uniref:hypothetical protein n=1 Tax=Azospirillum sp. TSO35-2 TaxID=716796 RepID=UPI000D60DAF8|nr:hypothetical protein [Azospirillum sp. TSO35-2]PWC39393.1 hypothetical protein TSO352_04310 [Azospirillum sp. TSO35-2]